MDLSVLPYIVANKILIYMESFPIYKQMDYFYTFKLDKFRKIYEYVNVSVMFLGAKEYFIFNKQNGIYYNETSKKVDKLYEPMIINI